MYVRRKGLPVVTIALVLLNVLVFALVEIQTGRDGYSGLYRSFIMVSYPGRVDTVWHKVLTSAFLHADFNHLVHNMIGLAMFGYVLECAIGHVRFLCGYLFTGIAGNVVSLLVYAGAGRESYMLGASGAVCGIIGMCLVYGLICYLRREPSEIDYRAVGFSLVYTIYYGFTVQNVNNTAHIAGAVAGVIYGALVLSFPSKMARAREDRRPWAGYGLCLLVTLCSLTAGLYFFRSRLPGLAEEYEAYLGELGDSFSGWSMEKLLEGEYEEDYYEAVESIGGLRGEWKVVSSGINSTYRNDVRVTAKVLGMGLDFAPGTVITVTKDTISYGGRELKYLLNGHELTVWGGSVEELPVIVVRNKHDAQAALWEDEYLINLEKLD